MDARTQGLLDLDEIRRRLAFHTAFEGGKALALALQPSGDSYEVGKLRAETEEAIHLAEHAVAGARGAFDVRPALASAHRGQVLTISDLERVRATIDVGVELRAGIAAHEEGTPLLWARLEAIDVGVLRQVAASLERALDGRGGLRDDASPELGGARRRLAHAREAAASTLRGMVTRLRRHLQETFTTERSGRPVLAVKASSKSAVPGIVHGLSSTGQTLFVEPYELLDANNAVREAEAHEKAEVERILAELTQRVVADEAELEYLVEALSAHDLATARAALSYAWRGCVVEDAEFVDLRRVRHPLLDPATAVPIDLGLEGVRALVISGPNTGGKTVGLKTLGLAAMISQCGMRVPAESARLPVFAEILADIGDDQSIALNLSTFSGHVRHLVEIMDVAGPGTLVLLDEVAGGTDPEEGGPLARAVIEALIARGATVLATTHLSALKRWAESADGVKNARVGIDPETLRPLYTLTVGQAGASHALDIARDLGLPVSVINAARAAMDPERRQADDLLRSASEAQAAAQRELRLAGEERMRAERAHHDAEEHRAEVQRRLERMRERAEADRERAREQARVEMRELTRELDGLRKEIAAARKAEKSRARVERSLHSETTTLQRRERERDQRLGDADIARERAQRALSGLTQEVEGRGKVAIGEVAHDPDMGLRGTVMSIKDGVAEIQGERLRMKVPVERLVADPSATRAAKRSTERTLAPRHLKSSQPAAATLEEIDVRGTRAHEAIAEVRRAVDDAAVAGRGRLRIIHGKGTGALRAAVREELGRHPLVHSAEEAPPNEGGDGATYAVLDPAAASTNAG